ncbi:MgtC/SapB family protein [Mucilaginibacter phyllosphaerae]|uniref:Mg2+ transporter-C (MgtC) family protein n=1 Tax=Mucilaginibacter phyllosphaerae TaxID=1812349 RepID=A0A4Y8A7X6_9SPHI|nr:MgtC/SapB family protein [Mucilaginibacter phyllosphaerae]MBB3970494.1 putative Mg2+ transporter-C (MgtC) family protein [Mucilaginibacter phyllosphaerae]TEW64510.1 MgtC/SapB family protein [Mucilaginibacter phyllosphaerae]GGH19137.1 membrane protein [Mucilaginibacter phyllosphaerae]
MDFSIQLGDIISMVMSVICGGIIGFEREYKNKSTGFRTIVLITLGSTIFTIVSRHGAGADDRISANIITGIGFIGAGVIFKDRMSVMGLTTAAVIWTAAAIGMTTGIGYHSLAFVFTIITLAILVLVEKVEARIGNMKRNKIYSVNFNSSDITQLNTLEEIIGKHGLKSKRLELYKSPDGLSVILQITGVKKNVDQLSEEMVNMRHIKDFH